MSYKKFWPSHDTYIANLPGSPFGSQAVIDFGGTGPGGGSEVIGLIRFDLSIIPASATITLATLTLTSVVANTAITEDFYRLVRAWTEAAATWTVAASGDNWGTAGAKNTTTDYNSTSLGTITYPTLTANDLVTVTIPTATVQGWVDGTLDNYGLRFDGQVVNADRNWHSKEGSIAAYWPYLEVWYNRMTIAYSVNSNAIPGGVRAFWPPMQTGSNGDGSPQYSDWYRHSWFIPEMEMANYLILQALRGTTITEVTTTDKDTPNSSAQYTTGRVVTVTGQQQGRRVLNVQVEFLLDAS